MGSLRLSEGAMNELIRLPRIGIGAAQQLYGLTARAIRYYEERGLVAAHRDRANQRYYDHEGRGRLAWISMLRQVGLSLPDIGEVLIADRNGVGPATAIAKLAQRRSELMSQIDHLDGVADGLSQASGGASAPAIERRRRAS